MNNTDTIEATYSEVPALEFDSIDWTKAPSILISRYWTGEEAPVSSHAYARIVWSDSCISVRFVCNQPDPPIVSSTPELTKKTLGLWDRDVCEIFVAPNPSDVKRYFEFEAAPTGEWVDLAIDMRTGERETDENFQSGMTTLTSFADDQLTTIIRVPWSHSIPKPKRGQEWRVNLFRCTGVGDQRYLAWQPTFAPEPNFHVPEAFGRLIFV